MINALNIISKPTYLYGLMPILYYCCCCLVDVQAFFKKILSHTRNISPRVIKASPSLRKTADYDVGPVVI